MAVQAETPTEVTKARNFESERVELRKKLSETKDEKAIRDLNQALAQIDADETNSKREGVGTRIAVGMTRGKNPLVISYERFDESQPATLPKSIAEFMEVTGVKDEETITSYLITGRNDALYTAASDPLAEYVNPSWPDDAQTQFRLVVRNYSRGANVSLEDAVTLIKPGFEKQFGGK